MKMNKMTMYLLGVAAVAFAVMAGKKETPPAARQLVFTMSPGIAYMVHTMKDGAPDSYREEVSKTTHVNVGEVMRNGGTLERVETLGTK